MLDMINPAGCVQPQFYSHGVVATGAQRTLFVSGQVGVDASGNVGADIGEQAKIAAANMNAVLAEAGMNGSNIAKVMIYLTDAATCRVSWKPPPERCRRRHPPRRCSS